MSMYTKDQFDRLLKTRKHWTGKQVGRAIIQSDVEQLNGKEPFATIDKMQGIIDALIDPKDINQYTLYANMYSGIINAWNYIDANGNDAIANLNFMKSIIASLTDYSNAENFHRRQPVMIGEKQFKKYKLLYQQRREEAKTRAENELNPVWGLIEDAVEINNDDWMLPHKNARSYGKNASKVIESYQEKYFTNDEIAYIRSIMQSLVTEVAHQRKKNKDELQLIDDEYDDFNSTYKRIVSDYDSIQRYNQWIKSNSLKDETVKKLKESNELSVKEIQTSGSLIPRYEFGTDKIVEATGKYISLIQQEQLKILYSQDVSFNEALKQALKKYPYSLKLSKGDIPKNDKEEQYPTVPYVPDKLSYADLFYANENTTKISSAFFHYLYMIGEGKNTAKQKELDDFLRKHFSDFFEAIKKDLIKKYPKLDKILNEVTNSTSYIIPHITTKRLAVAGVEWAKESISDNTDIHFSEVFPKEDREQASHFGFAVVYSHYPSEPDDEDNNHKIITLADEPIEQHYDIPEFIERTLTNRSKELEASVKTIRRFAVLQQAYEDYFKGIARIANDKGFREYDKTTAYPKLQNAIETYEKALYNLIATLHQITDNPDEESKLISLIKKHLPLISLKPIKYKHKTIKEVASLLERSYLSSTPTNTMTIFNILAKGAEW